MDKTRLSFCEYCDSFIAEITERCGICGTPTIPAFAMTDKTFDDIITIETRKVAKRIEELENEAAQWNAIRSEVQRFAFAMEERLKANDHKGGWENESVEWLVKRMREEVAELEQEIDYRRNIIGEASDVANFCMMIADVAGQLK